LFTVIHTLGLSVSTSRLLRKDLNTETITSNHYEVFLSFLVQSTRNLGTELKLCSNPESESESESYVTTDGQSASLSWYKAPIRGLRPDFYFRSEHGIRLTVTFLIPCGALCDERTGLSFVCTAGPCQRSLSRVLVSWDLSPYFTVSDLRLPFCRLLRLAGSWWRYSTPPPHWDALIRATRCCYIDSARTTQKTRPPFVMKLVYSLVA
jgi:hypothetical protein